MSVAQRADARPETGGGVPPHAQSAADVLARFDTTRDGLSAGEAARRLEKWGRNALPAPPRRSALMRFFAQFRNVLIYVLLAAAAVTAALGHWVDAGVILGVVLVNSLIGFVQEGKAEKALDAIRDMLSLHATVVREASRHEIAADTLVPGDVVMIASGDKVPADLRLLDTRTLKIDEAMLTGESVPVEKNAEAVAAAAPVGDRSGMAHSGTLVTSGQGTGVVVATGAGTEIGRISELLARVEDMQTPLTRRMGVFARKLTLTVLVAAALTFVFGIAVRDYSAAEMFLAAVSLAVAAIPEGLPAIMTITLAIGVQRMARRHSIIRHLPAVETLGSVTVICSDKTGTLTRNEMMVQSVVTGDEQYGVSGAGYAPDGGFSDANGPLSAAARGDLIELARVAVLCNDATLAEREGAWRLEGDPTEGALLALGLKAGLDPRHEQKRAPRVDLIPFESEHRFMATLHHDHSGHAYACVKGAPERVLEMCSSVLAGGVAQHMDRAAWQAHVERLASDGQRVLALAIKPFDTAKSALDFDDLDGGLTLLGLTGIIDPPREEAVAAVARCRDAGIRVKMITGDHQATARAIGQMLGIGDGTRALTGAEVAKLGPDALREVVRDTDVFARASPEHKLILVEAMQANGDIVAMTGDGVNDAPALKRADVGVAMGMKGTEAAKEAADMVLSDDNFASIAQAVEEGRTVYDNLKKSITFLLPINGGESLAIVAAVLFGVTLPVTPVQILWVNMVSSVALALALAFEPTEPDVMVRPPRAPTEPVLSRFLVWRVALVSLLILAGVFGMFEWALHRGMEVEAARTIAVNTLIAMEVFYLFSVRYLRTPSFTWTGVKGTRAVLAAVGIVFVLQLFFTYAPFMHVLFASRPLTLGEGVLCALVGLALLIALEIEKGIRRAFGIPGPLAQQKRVQRPA